MRKFKGVLFIWLIWLGSSAFLKAQPEVTAAGELFNIKLGNGLNAILMPSYNTNHVELTFYIRSGSMYENDSLSGMSNLLVKILKEKITAGIKNSRTALSAQNTTFSAYLTTEDAVFKLTTTPENVNACLTLVRDTIYNSKISKADLNNARNSVLQQIEDSKYDLNKVFESKIIQYLFVQDHSKLEILGNADDIKAFDLNDVISFYKKYYVPNNTIATETGSFEPVASENTFETAFKPVLKSEFNPESVTKIVDLRPLAYNTQFIVEDSAGPPEFQICWQFPGTNSNFHESYCAFLINALLNDKNNYIQVKAAKMGCKKFVVQYDANNYSGIFRIIIQPSKQNLYSTLQFVTTELGRLNKTILNDAMIGVAKLEFKREYQSLKKTKDYPMWIAKHWTYNDDSYFPGLCDSVMSIPASRLEQFVIAYFNQSSHVTGLKISKADRESLKIDTAFTDLDQNVSKYVFTYQQNVTSTDGPENQTKLQNLLQWLKNNPDINVQVNGFSDESEYNKTTDEDSIIAFMDSLPTFSKVNTQLIKHKRTIRPEMARAVKIVKYLYEHGISSERLSGTAMMFKSNNKQEAADNMKCTLTLNKERKSPSLYEYHYGRKKE